MWKMYDGENWKEPTREEKGTHALKASDTYIFKCTNCFQGLSAHWHHREAPQNNVTLQLQTLDFGASVVDQNKCSSWDLWSCCEH